MIRRYNGSFTNNQCSNTVSPASCSAVTSLICTFTSPEAYVGVHAIFCPWEHVGIDITTISDVDVQLFLCANKCLPFPLWFMYFYMFVYVIVLPARSSYAASYRYAPASTSIRTPSALPLPSNLVGRDIDLHDPLPKCYTINAALGITGKGTSFESQICRWINQKLSLGADEHQCVPRQALMLSPSVDTLVPHIRSNLFPDGSIRDGEGISLATIFCFEVDSSVWHETTAKLAIHLCQMLSSLRNRLLPSGHKDSTLCLQGLYFPKSGKEECVVIVKIEWSDQHLKFHESHKYVTDSDDIERIVDGIYHTNIDLWRRTEKPETDDCTFSYPVSPDYIRRVISPDARQTKSGQSVVIIVPSSNLAYKFTFNLDERAKNYELLLMSGLKANPQIAIANSHKRIGKVTFFQFDLFKPPLSIAKIKLVAKPYFESLISAVKFLHDHSVAHLDLRIENICVSGTPSDFHVVIIDLERYERTATSAREIKSKYELSEMYSFSDQTWTAENLDWKQVGIILKQVFEGGIESYRMISLLQKGR